MFNSKSTAFVQRELGLFMSSLCRLTRSLHSEQQRILLNHYYIRLRVETHCLIPYRTLTVYHLYA